MPSAASPPTPNRPIVYNLKCNHTYANAQLASGCDDYLKGAHAWLGHGRSRWVPPGLRAAAGTSRKRAPQQCCSACDAGGTRIRVEGLVQPQDRAVHQGRPGAPGRSKSGHKAWTLRARDPWASTPSPLMAGTTQHNLGLGEPSTYSRAFPISQGANCVVKFPSKPWRHSSFRRRG